MIMEIFLSSGIVWQIWEDSIRTRESATGRVIMRRKKCGGKWQDWLTAANNLDASRRFRLERANL
jgi:hypothetical protein